MENLQKKFEPVNKYELPFILKKLIDSTGMELADFCRKIEIGYATIYQILSGKNQSPRVETILPIAKYFNVSIEQLIGEEPLDNPVRKKGTSISSDTKNTVWQNQLFHDCAKVVSCILEKHTKEIGIDQFLATIKEVYMYSVSQKLKKADKKFATWYCKHYFH
ncbi:helix-turn-helix domain-containing protein [Cysteiniphilum sp. 6C5]|uniref:helix-turn-helix domain-containing protein n=1 Tax=unclassified Cysteiniphilum TaxID=2610889 RepID=UPI003F8681A6